ncbi:MAG: AAA family ATPase [Candidatus Promineifilaceae bacterium]|nr:AAA family ATPase [Candidatus Promineifilaceae bacterium]
MTKIYAIANQKGGVGKTTSVINLASILGSRGFRTLVVDADPQANATSGLGYDKNALDLSTYDLLLEADGHLDGIAISNSEFSLDLVPSAPALAGAEVELVNVIGREYRLQQALEETNGRYDYILIDCPPSLGLLTINGLVAAAQGVIIPVQCEYLALEGLTQLIKTIELVQKFLNPNLVIRGLIMTMYDSRTNLSRQVVNEVRHYFKSKVFRTIVPRNIRLSEAPSYGLPINIYAPNSAGGVAYQLLATEILKGDQSAEGSK